MTGNDASINPGRQLCTYAFRDTLENVLGKERVTELDFAREWSSRISEQPSLTSNGWYDPPPGGVAVFSGSDNGSGPFRFSSLRGEDHWPSSEKVIDWQHAIIYAYCSPYDTTLGLPADFGITLYFGTDREIIAFYRRALGVTKDIVETIQPEMSVRTLFDQAVATIRAAGMSNNVSSVTHSDPNDIGHSFPYVEPAQLNEGRLSASTIATIRNSRKYVCRDDNWPLSEVAQFTIEPNLISLKNPSLPQFSPHYVAALNGDVAYTSTDCDELYTAFGLL